MSDGHITTVGLTSKSTQFDPRWGWDCTCGESAPKLYANKGAAGFSASCHEKKALGLPVFAKKDAAPAATTELRVSHATLPSGEIACGAGGAILATAFSPEHATCEPCREAYAEYRAGVPTEYPDGGYMLPVTLRLAPSAEYAVERFRTFRGRYEGEGSAFEAVLTRNGKKVATVMYFGDGGETEVDFCDTDVVKHGNPYDSDEKTAFGEYVNRWVGVWSVERDGMPALDWCFDGVIAVLVNEASALAALKRTKSVAFVLSSDISPVEGTGGDFRTVSGSASNRAAALKWLAAREPSARVWVVSQASWVPVAEAV